VFLPARVSAAAVVWVPFDTVERRDRILPPWRDRQRA